MPKVKREEDRLNRQVSLRLTEREHALVEAMAEADERSPTDIARRAFRNGLPKVMETFRARGIVVPEGLLDDEELKG